MKAKRKLLKVDLEYDFKLIGIITPLKDYRLAWHINKLASIRLKRLKEQAIHFEDLGTLLISALKHTSTNLEIILLKNKSQETENNKFWLIPELKQYDYFLLIKDETEKIDVEAIESKIKAIPNVEFSLSLSPEKIKSKENLFF